MIDRQRVPMWFWVVAALLLLWQLAGVASFYAHVTMGAEGMGPEATEYDRQLVASLPLWYDIVFAIATFGGLLSGIALLARRRVAVPLAAVSLVAIVVMFGWMFLATDIIAVKGVWTTYFPIAIFVVGLITLWFARLARARRWIG